MSDPPEQEPPFEYRKELRRRSLLPGLIVVPQTQWTFDCVIRNLSESGAKIDIPPDAPIPSRFILVDMKNSVAHEAEMVRRNNAEAGLRLLRHFPLSEMSSPEVLQLRRLLMSRQLSNRND